MSIAPGFMVMTESVRFDYELLSDSYHLCRKGVERYAHGIMESIRHTLS